MAYAILNANGTLTPEQSAGCGADPTTGAVTGCTLPDAQNPASPQQAGTTPSQQSLAQRPPPPHPTAWRTTWDTRSWSTVTTWWDDTYLYTRTDDWTYTTYTKTLDWSNGAVTTDIWTTTTHTWDTVSQLLIDLSHPIKLPTPQPGPATAATSAGTASDDGTCGEGGSAITCATPTGHLPPGALPQQTQAQQQAEGQSPQTSAGGAGAASGGNGPGGTNPPTPTCPADGAPEDDSGSMTPRGASNLKDNIHMSTSDALDTASEFLGDKYTEVDNGVFQSPPDENGIFEGYSAGA